jgi:hypothetical protein
VVAEGDGGGWQRGPWVVGKREYARMTNGQIRKIRKWNSRTGEWDMTDAGRDYYNHNRQKFIINVKCFGYVSPLAIRNPQADSFENDAAHDANEDGSTEDDPMIRSDYYGHGQSTLIIPLIPERIVDGDDSDAHPSALQALANLGLVRDQDYSQADIETALRAAVPELLRRLPRVNTVEV